MMFGIAYWSVELNGFLCQQTPLRDQRADHPVVQRQDRHSRSEGGRREITEREHRAP
jgi:hypothetical protein